ncbi:yjeF C-terminal region, hydroxyethylthiazole kinase-related [Flavobacterium swingsii]|uniref:ADP-dependent (S)-NAD(P)H-hydrate dehydratase n=1 Tax=Flavobacterium swingsii TaxID=498292 RepID=A0A1I0ZTB6_9FLAO|nr:NAD(P)H-hydrate dehydratase [Flavobacterium swingsii]SFB27690.1 yjeF C-terminal region, hydroxyethylthiazole kinase-related [Flavobacterium swingsii]
MGDFCQIDKQEIIKRYKPIDKYTHKGLRGHALIIGGSYGKMGSVVLASKACIKAGAGLVTAYIPKCGYDIVQISVPEVMVITDDYLEHIIKIDYKLQPQAIGIGIGMGQHPDTGHAFLNFLKMNKLPLVVDADALNILSQNKEWLSLLPKKTILTPHQKELERLIGEWNSEDEKLEMVRKICIEYDLIFVLKGVPTIIIDNTSTYENTTGNQALATAGSGDVLTGIITSLVAQSYKPIDAAIIGVYLHGLTADIAYPDVSYQSFIASDIIETLGEAYLHIIA